MRTVILNLIVCFPLLSYGQFNFTPDSADSIFPFEAYLETELRLPNTDSTTFELRFWINSEFGGFLQLTFNTDSVWNFRRGFLSGKYEVRTSELTSKQPNIDSIWLVLLSNNILELPSQDEIVYTFQKGGRTIKIGPEKDETEPLVHNTLDGVGYTIELFTKQKYRSYYYYNPVTLSEHFEKFGWTSIETEQFANITNILINAFALNEIFKANLKEKISNK